MTLLAPLLLTLQLSTPASAAGPLTGRDGAWLSVSGTALSPTPRTLDADSIYVVDQDTWLTSGAADEDGSPDWLEQVPLRSDEARVQGIVKEVQPKRHSFTIDNGAVDITVDTDKLGYDPLDGIGLQQIEPGDRVSVVGHLEHGFFEGNVITARSLTTLRALSPDTMR